VRRRRALRIFAFGLAGLTAETFDPRLVPAVEFTQKIARVGFVDPNLPSTSPRYQTVFWERLRDLGWVEGQNLVIEVRWAEGRYERLPTLMADVVAAKVDVLATWSTPAAIAAKNATSTIPIVDAVMADPVGLGIAASLAQPGGNLTGLSMGWDKGIAGKWLELLQEMVPRLSTVAVISEPDHPMNQDQAKRLEAIAPTRGIKVRIIEARGPEGLNGAFDEARRRAQAVVVLPDSNMIGHQRRVVALAAAHRLPDMHVLREFVDAGGLIAYAPDLAIMFQRAADYVDKILRGARPGDLPIEQPTQYVLVVNLKTAKALGITVPESILVRADEVIR